MKTYIWHTLFIQHSNIFHITSGKILKNSFRTTYVQQKKRQMKRDEMDKEKL